jgi:hypothetical protein
MIAQRGAKANENVTAARSRYPKILGAPEGSDPGGAPVAHKSTTLVGLPLRQRGLTPVAQPQVSSRILEMMSCWISEVPSQIRPSLASR